MNIALFSAKITPYNVGSVLWRLFSTSGGTISNVGDSFSTVEVVQYSGRIHQYMRGDKSVLWRVFSTVEGTFSTVGETAVYVGDNISTVGDSFSTVEGIQYIGG